MDLVRFEDVSERFCFRGVEKLRFREGEIRITLTLYIEYFCRLIGIMLCYDE